MIAAWSVDRLGRSLQHLVSFLDEIHRKRVDLYLHQQGIDTTTPAGKALFHDADRVVGQRRGAERQLSSIWEAANGMGPLAGDDPEEAFTAAVVSDW